MPLTSCGPGHWKWGDKGKCYNNKKDALKQGYAEDPKHFEQVMKSGSSLDFALAKRILIEEAVRVSVDDLDETRAYMNTEQRKKVAEQDFAGPHNTFPITDQKHVEYAAQLIGHAADPQAVKHKIKEIVRRKGLKLPKAWENESAN